MVEELSMPKNLPPAVIPLSRFPAVTDRPQAMILIFQPLILPLQFLMLNENFRALL